MGPVVAGIAITALAAAGMVVARFLGGTQAWQYLLGGTFAVALAGAWMAKASAAMATAVDPNMAMLRGAAAGALIGVMASGVLLACVWLLRKAGSSERPR